MRATKYKLKKNSGNFSKMHPMKDNKGRDIIFSVRWQNKNHNGTFDFFGRK